MEYRVGRKRPGVRRPEFLPRMNKADLLDTINRIDFLHGYNDIYIGEVFPGSNTDYTGRTIMLKDISDRNVEVTSVISGNRARPELNTVVIPVAELSQYVDNFFYNALSHGGRRRSRSRSRRGRRISRRSRR